MRPDLVGRRLPVGGIALALFAQVLHRLRRLQIGAVGTGLVYHLLQQLDGNIIGPKILGNTTGLSSFWVLFAILLFGGLWGFVGMIIGVPLFAVIYDVIKKLVIHGLRRNEELEMLTAYHDEFGQE